MSAIFSATGPQEPRVVVCEHCGRVSGREPGASCEGCGSSRTRVRVREPRNENRSAMGTTSRGAR